MTDMGAIKTLESRMRGVLQQVDERYRMSSDVQSLMHAMASAILEEGVADGVVVDVVFAEEESQSLFAHREKVGMEKLSAVIKRREEQTLGRSPRDSVTMGDTWLWRDDLQETTRPMVWSDKEGREFITDLQELVEAQSLAVLPLEGAGRAVGSLTLIGGRESGLHYYEGDRQALQGLADGLGVRIDGALWRREAKQSREAKKDRAIYERILDGRGVGVLVLSAEAQILDCNQTAVDLLGYATKTELNARPLEELLKSKSGSTELDEAVRRGESLEVERTVFHRADNSPLALVASVVSLQDSEAEGEAVVLFRHLTKYQGLQAELLAADRVIALGTLASGLAHEINNPLAFSKANITYVFQSLEEGGERREALSEAMEGLDRIEEIVAGMKVFGTSGRHEAAEDNSLEWAIREALRLCEGAVKPHATVALEGIDQLGSVRAENSKLVQLMMNLVLNAASAIEDAEGNEKGHIEVVGAHKNGEYHISIIDNGVGISPEERGSIFDPFFTTREGTTGTQGSGLGLYICRSITADLGGSIEVESTPGQGSVFRIRLPQSAEA